MWLRWLEVRDLRCYHRLRFDPDPETNILVGENGSGKTSLLEAVAYLGLLRSFRGTPDDSIIREGAAAAVIRGEFEGRSGQVRVEVELPASGRRRVLRNGKRPARNRDLLTEVPVVAFQPDDLDLVKRGPSLRRAYLDDLAAQLWPQAVADQAEFDRALRQRNSLLRREGPGTDPITLDVWDERLATSGARVMWHRSRVMHELDGPLAEAYRLVGAEGYVTWRYLTNWDGADRPGPDEMEGALRSALSDGRRKDLERRVTSVGPHRDDPVLMIDGRPARTQASQGEQRTAALALRIAAYRVLRERRDMTPILLLDDVFSELDHSRARGVLELLPGGQVFVTTARDDEPGLTGRPAGALGGRSWRVAKGSIT